MTELRWPSSGRRLPCPSPLPLRPPGFLGATLQSTPAISAVCCPHTSHRSLQGSYGCQGAVREAQGSAFAGPSPEAPFSVLPCHAAALYPISALQVLLHLKLNKMQPLRKHTNKLIAHMLPYPCALPVALDLFSFPETDGLLQKNHA